MKQIVALALVVALAGCLGSDPAALEPNEEPMAPVEPEEEPIACADPLVHCRMEATLHDCWDVAAIFFVDMAHVDSYLPEGFKADAAPRTLARLGLSNFPSLVQQAPTMAPDLDSFSLVGLVHHNCNEHIEALGTMQETWILAAVEPAAEGFGLDLPYAPFEVFDIGFAGGSQEVHERRASLGWTLFGNRTETGPMLSSNDLLTSDAATYEGDEQVTSIAVRNAAKTPDFGGDRIRFWHASDLGVAYTDAIFAEPYSFALTNDFECTMAPGSLPAEVIGYTSCEAAALDPSSPAPGGSINPTHYHDIVFEYIPFEQG